MEYFPKPQAFKVCVNQLKSWLEKEREKGKIERWVLVFA